MKNFLFSLAITAAACPVQASNDGFAASFTAPRFEHQGDSMRVSLDMILDRVDVGRNRAVVLTPAITSATDSIAMHSVGVYGRNRYYHYVRNGSSMLTDDSEQSFAESRKPDTLTYVQTVAFEPWMTDCGLSMTMREFGCCEKLIRRDNIALGRFTETAKRAFMPRIIYVSPKAEVAKSRSLEGSAFIDFPVNRTEIRPDYRRNSVELAKINATIDSVYSDPDITITSVWLKGFASPESPYSHNRDLAIGRTEALKQYIGGKYNFEGEVISTAYEPEDWAGLRRYVENSTELANKEAIIELIDSDIDPDVKEKRIKSRFPADYRFLLKNCYPALRHTDYRISYTVRSFTDIEEIKRMLSTQPSKLNLNEIYLVAQTYEPGSQEFSDVMETAVRLFPDDQTANLNAAANALKNNNADGAAKYLTKSGNSAEADYLRAIAALRGGDKDSALNLLRSAASRGLEPAAEALKELAE